jgi:enoyl-CoA hydratase/carnithine racemase
MSYTQEQINHFSEQTFGYLLLEEAHHVLRITLNRADKKNALHPQMVNELAYALRYAHFRKSIWAVVLDAAGDVFCAGADLKSFAGDTDGRTSTIPAPDGEILLGELFAKVHKPCIAKVTGDVYAGGFMLLSGCHYVVACNHIKLGLPEVKRGLFPFQVMASLLEVMPQRKVLDWCMRGYNLEVEQAYEWGLVTHISIAEQIETDVQELLQQLLENSPSAIRLGLEAYDHLRQTGIQNQHQYLLNKFMETIQTKDAQEGIAAFREKRRPIWVG